MGNSAEVLSYQLADFQAWPDWLNEQQKKHKAGSSILGSPGAVAWFFRKHRKRLVESGELILRKGPGGHYVGPGIGEVCLQIMREESQANL